MVYLIKAHFFSSHLLGLHVSSKEKNVHKSLKQKPEALGQKSNYELNLKTKTKHNTNTTSLCTENEEKHLVLLRSTEVWGKMGSASKLYMSMHMFVEGKRQGVSE